MDTAELITRHDILDVLNRYARGADRNDWPTVRACYHDDAFDDHGLYQGGVDGLMDFLAATAARFSSTTHHLCNHLAQVDDDHRARCETHCLAWYRRTDREGREGRERCIAQGLRYLDRLDKRNGRWAIAHRVCVLDWEQVFDAVAQAPIATTWQRGARGAADPSHGFFDSSLIAAS